MGCMFLSDQCLVMNYLIEIRDKFNLDLKITQNLLQFHMDYDQIPQIAHNMLKLTCSSPNPIYKQLTVQYFYYLPTPHLYFSMNHRSISPQHFKVENGKLLPWQYQEPKIQNYRVIYHHPLNLATDTYTQATIAQQKNMIVQLESKYNKLEQKYTYLLGKYCHSHYEQQHNPERTKERRQLSKKQKGNNKSGQKEQIQKLLRSGKQSWLIDLLEELEYYRWKLKETEASEEQEIDQQEEGINQKQQYFYEELEKAIKEIESLKLKLEQSSQIHHQLTEVLTQTPIPHENALTTQPPHP